MTTGIMMLAMVIIITLVHLTTIKAKSSKWMHITKPLIVPSILLYYVFSASTISFILIAGLMLSLLGDVLLMLDSKYFMPGLVSFAGTHVCNIAVFLIYGGSRGVSLFNLLLVLPYVCSAVFLYSKIIRNSGSAKKYFMLYMLVILSMSYASLCRAWNLGGIGTLTAFIGSLLFIASDGTLALGIVSNYHKNNDMFVMATYTAAQLLIVSSLL